MMHVQWPIFDAYIERLPSIYNRNHLQLFIQCADLAINSSLCCRVDKCEVLKARIHSIGTLAPGGMEIWMNDDFPTHSNQRPYFRLTMVI